MVNKTIIFFILLFQLTSITISEGSFLYEVFVFIIAYSIGISMKIAWTVKKWKSFKYSDIFILLVIGFGVAALINYSIVKGVAEGNILYKIKPVFVGFGAFAAEFILEWFEKKYPKIFDSFANKTGILTKDDNEESE